MNRLTYYIILRYSDKLAPPPGTIKLHEEVIKKHGSVWLGKFGRRISDQVVDRLKNQIKAQKPTYIFLTQALGKQKFMIHAGLLENIERKIDEQDLIPQYYHDRSDRISTWFRISRFMKLSPKVLTVLIGRSSGVPIFRTLSQTVAAMLLVSLKQNEKLEDYLVD